ncbi:MAG TPA: class I SAM-dependent methyltransferase [Gemmatimonadaceae bacterium]|nr:class I SAM-dependent methyltransferase [Gemmatimonadaceae bacterium]
MTADTSEELKSQVRDHWEQEVCGTRYGASEDRRSFFAEIERTRYEQDDMLRAFACFNDARGKKVLEVGVGAGTDLTQWARAGATVYGIDLTDAAVELSREHLALEGLSAEITRGDAEHLTFSDNFFDIYYSWGVLHHTPNTEQAIAEAYRVLRPGGTLKIMLYHWPSVGALLVWLLYGPLRLRFLSPRATYARYVESPGTRMFSLREARGMIGRHFSPDSVRTSTFLAAGDLLTQKLSRRYKGLGWNLVQRFFPRWFVRRVLGNRFGTVMTIEATK